MWKDLTQDQKAEVMDLYLSKGITSLSQIRDFYDSALQGNTFSNGGKIYIKPENRGKFTALKERTGHSSTWFKEHGTPAQKKMATFALNARKWQHPDGGRIYIGGADQEVVVTPEQTFMQSIANRDPYVDYQFYSPTGNSIVQTINSTPRWQQYWADQEGSRVSNAMHQASPKVFDLLTAVDAVATGPEMLEGLYGLYNLGKKRIYVPHKISKTIDKIITESPIKTLSLTNSKIRTRIGDVEINNPNLLYHLDRGDNIGAFSSHGAFIKEGKLFPGTPKDNGSISYSWWNKGKPYATHINGEPMTRLMTTTEDTPGMLHVRSQKYPIGQWDGKKGLVTKAEYVNSNPVDVEGSIYMLDPNYGYRRIIPNVSTAEFKATPRTPKITEANAASITPEQWTAAQDAAIARGDMSEAQRLRDLHFKVSAPDADLPVQFHGTEGLVGNKITFGTPSKYRYVNYPFYTSSNKFYASLYGPKTYKFYINENDANLIKASNKENFMTVSKDRFNELVKRGNGTRDISRNDEITIFSPTKYKLADAVTFDDKGVRVPLGERDNFKLNDIRYGLIPLGLGLGAATITKR